MRDRERGSAAENGLTFFGKMSASISHEIKNVLAIINENAGLTEDLLALSESGRPIDPARLKSLAGKVKDQVKRGDEIVKTMNRFAHSVDREVCEVVPEDILSVSAALSRRLALIKGFEVVLDCRKDIPPITTSPFYIYNLLWLFMDRAMAEGGASLKLVLWADDSGGELKMGVKRSPCDGAELKANFPSDAERRLADVLGARIDVDASRGIMYFSLKRTVGE